MPSPPILPEKRLPYENSLRSIRAVRKPARVQAPKIEQGSANADPRPRESSRGLPFVAETTVRVFKNGPTGSPQAVLSLQRIVGNAAVASLLGDPAVNRSPAPDIRPLSPAVSQSAATAGPDTDSQTT